MPEKARYLTAHRMRFPDIWTPDPARLTGRPDGALSWKIGPSGPVGPNGYRLPADRWGAVGLYPDLATAQAALASTSQFMPFLDDAVESWHGLLQPFMHRGECNHLDRDQPGTIFDVDPAQTDGLCAVMTTAGFVLGPDLNMDRVIDFRRNVDIANDWIAQADGCLANQTFTPHTYGDDGVTISLWRDDASMLAAAYHPGVHRALIDRHKAEPMLDRSSFTRCRILASHGQWNGRNPAQP